MKKISLLAVVLGLSFLGAPAAESRDDLQFFLSFGYGLPIGGRYVGASEIWNVQNPPRFLIEKKDIYLNYGRGLKLEAGGAYQFIKGLYGQASFQYCANIPTITEEDQTITTVTVIDQTDYTNSQFSLKFALVPRVRIFDLLDIDIGVGSGIAFTTASSKNPASLAYTVYDYLPAILFTGFFSVNFPVSDFASLYGKFGFDAMNVTMKRSTDYDRNNVVDDVPVEYATNSLTQQEPPKTPASSFDLSLGIRFGIF